METKRISALTVLLCLLLGGCTMELENTNVIGLILSPNETYQKTETVEYEVVDDPTLYTHRDTVDTLYLAVAPGNAADNTNHTWTDMHTVPLEDQGSSPYLCEGVLQLGDENAPIEGAFGYGLLTANCTVRLQGANASTRQQKSYRISIKDGMGSIDGIKTLVLAKSFTDPLRVTNALCFRLLEQIPDLLSTRARLVHLYVKDTDAGPDALYRDYGMYTMVEPINKNYFKKRNLDDDGGIYKINHFDFGRHADVLAATTSPEFSQEAFEQMVEIKGDQDITNLLAMLDDVNNCSIPIWQVIDTWFDANNLYSFLAFNLLTGNRDAEYENYYLYNPTGSARFYFVPWDNDAAFRDDYNALRGQPLPDWDSGVFSYWNNVLFRRILEDDACISRLSTAVDTLYEAYLTEENVNSIVRELTAQAQSQIYSLPDRTFARVTQTQYQQLAQQVGHQVTENYSAYYESLEHPAPFHLHAPERLGDGAVRLSWDAAVCSQPVAYTLEVDDSWDFKTPLYSAEGLTDTYGTVGELPEGQYFFRVTAYVPNGHSQIAYEFYNTELKTTCHGVLCFYVLADGSVHPSYFTGGE